MNMKLIVTLVTALVATVLMIVYGPETASFFTNQIQPAIDAAQTTTPSGSPTEIAP